MTGSAKSGVSVTFVPGYRLAPPGYDALGSISQEASFSSPGAASSPWVRPKMITVVAIMAGLLPIMWSAGTGSEIMQRIAVPMIGGMVSSTLLTLIVIPAIFGLVKGYGLPREPNATVPGERDSQERATTSDPDRWQAAE